MAFTVTEIIDGNSIRVSPGWKWGEQSGDLVMIVGYPTPTPSNVAFAVSKLTTLIKNKQVELKNAKQIIDNKIYCSVFLNEIDISQYFPELKTT